MAYNQETTVITHAAAAAGVTGTDCNSANSNGLLLFINITAITGGSPTLQVTIQGRGPAGAYYNILASAALTATGLTVLRVYPGLTAAANLTANDILPAGYRVVTVIGGTTPAVTATISAVQVS